MVRKRENSCEIYDILIIGGGPAGLTAGTYSARSGMDVLLLESLSVMGQATMTEKIENYPGIESISGFDLIQVMKKQADNFGLNIKNATVISFKHKVFEDDPFWQIETKEEKFLARSVIVASGAQPKKLDIPGEKEFLGRGVSYCGTCDGAFFRDKNIIVVGGGDTAVEEALYLTRFGKKVTIVHRRDRLRASKVLQERAFQHEKINFIWKKNVKQIKGDNKVQNILLEDVDTGKKKVVECDGIFIFVGWIPNTDFLPGEVETKKKAILVNKEMHTNVKGVFAAGDCCKKEFHQIVTACGDGANAAHQAQLFVERLKGTAYE